MKTATITQAKNGLSALIDRVRTGESVILTDRGIPVARIEPIRPEQDPGARLARLQRAGIVRIGDKPPPLDLVRQPGPALSGGASAVAVLLDERRAGR